MPGTLQPLDQQFPIVDNQGRPTLYFTQWAQQRQIDITDSITLQQAQDLINEWAAGRQIIAGRALDGGGFLSGDVTIDHAESLVVPGTYGDATHVPSFVVDQEGHIQGVVLVPITGGGGGAPWYFKPPLAANFSTMYASLRGGSIANVLTLSDDADVGMAYVDNSGDSGYMKATGRPIPPAFIGGNFTITARMTANSYTANDQWGIWVRASATKYIFFDLFNRGGSMNIQRAFYNAAWNDGSFSLSWESPEIWLRIVVANQTTSYWVSADGKHWTQCYASENLFAAPFTDYGFCMGRFSTTAKWFITCDSFTSDEYP